jgi:hypothetical protein
MSALTVNLKQMVQRQPAGLACGALGVMVVLIFMLTGDPGWDNTVLMISLFSWAVGMVIGIMQKDILNKPFALVLPGHHEMVRRMSFLVGAGFAVLCLFGCPSWIQGGLQSPGNPGRAIDLDVVLLVRGGDGPDTAVDLCVSPSDAVRALPDYGIAGHVGRDGLCLSDHCAVHGAQCGHLDPAG